MSIMFPTIFALGIFGLGARAKKASAFIVMAIMGGAILPKLMGYVADQYDMSRSFIVPMVCFAFVARTDCSGPSSPARVAVRTGGIEGALASTAGQFVKTVRVAAALSAVEWQSCHATARNS